MLFDMKLSPLLLEALTPLLSRLRDNFARIQNSFFLIAEKAYRKHSFNIRPRSNILDHLNRMKWLLATYRKNTIQIYHNNKITPELFIIYLAMIYFIISNIVFIERSTEQKPLDSVTLSIDRSRVQAERVINTTLIQDKENYIAPQQFHNMPVSLEEHLPEQIVDDEQQHFFRQHAVGSKIFVFDGFIDIMFDEKSLDIDKVSVSLTHIMPPTPKPKPRRHVTSKEDKAPASNALPISASKRSNKPLLPTSMASKPDVNDVRKAVTEDLLSSYKVVNDGGGFRVVVPGVDLFSRNSEALSERALQILKPIAETAKRDDDLALTIVGHTDSLKSVDASRALSRLRAELVKGFLTDSFGIRADRMEVFGEGKGSPIASNSTLDGRQANRRIEIAFEKR